MQKILIIEDDNILQQAITAALKKAKFKVSTVLDGAKVIPAIKKEKPDLILLDLLLPHKDGYQILKELKKTKRTNDIPVYVFTMVEDENSMAECLSLGALCYFLKSDYTLDEIVARVKKYFQKSSTQTC